MQGVDQVQSISIFFDILWMFSAFELLLDLSNDPIFHTFLQMYLSTSIDCEVERFEVIYHVVWYQLNLTLSRTMIRAVRSKGA